MHRYLAIAFAGAALSLGIASAHAGPCTSAIAQFERALRQSANDPGSGPTARQSIGAQLSHQPTPSSVKRADERAQTNFAAALAPPQAARRPRQSLGLHAGARRSQTPVRPAMRRGTHHEVLRITALNPLPAAVPSR